jgi:predicted glycoside hydrolase/deacetylase ChbG (UPF0249 family)
LSTRFLIVNADDFGRSDGVNAGVARGHEDGIVTSASLMVRWPAASRAAGYARRHPELSVGLHVDLGEWVYQDGDWHAAYDLGGSPGDEVARQLAIFRELVGRDPTHLDSHQHVHRSEPAHSVCVELSRRLAIPLRDSSPTIPYSGGFYGQTAHGDPLHDAISVDALIGLLHDLPDGVTELGCHPATVIDFETTYADERMIELNTLCDPRVRDAVAAAGVTLCSFAEAIEAR